MTTKDKMHSGQLYDPNDADIQREQLVCLDKLYDFNQTRPTELDKREKMLSEMFAEIGEGCYIEPPLHSNWGGKHVHFGKNVYANFNLTLVDDTHIYVGDCTLIGPNVTIATAGHPIQPELREKAYQYNKPVHIGRNCWIGAGAIIVPGVTIGDNTVIGAGSVVTKDIPSGVVAVGNPCRVLREVVKIDGSMASDNADNAGDTMFPKAVRLAVENGSVSTSLLQRKLSLGYGRAAKIIDLMQEMGIVSAPDGPNPGKVLINMQDYQEMFNKKSD